MIANTLWVNWKCEDCEAQGFNLPIQLTDTFRQAVAAVKTAHQSTRAADKICSGLHLQIVVNIHSVN